jgi:hypothetical protein
VRVRPRRLAARVLFQRHYTLRSCGLGVYACVFSCGACAHTRRAAHEGTVHFAELAGTRCRNGASAWRCPWACGDRRRSGRRTWIRQPRESHISGAEIHCTRDVQATTLWPARDERLTASVPGADRDRGNHESSPTSPPSCPRGLRRGCGMPFGSRVDSQSAQAPVGPWRVGRSIEGGLH